MDKDLQEKILNSFPNSKLVGSIRSYNTGQSGASVFAALYSPNNPYGLDGTFVVKIGSVSWANAEEDRYKNLSKSAFASLVARFHMLSKPDEGLAAVAYDVAFDSLITPQTLMNILDEGVQNEETTQRQVEQLIQALVDGHLNSKFNKIVKDLHTLLFHMLTEKRTRDLRKRLAESLPFWHANSFQIIVEDVDKLLPNPVIYMDESVWKKIQHSPVCLVNHIHGDLHTGNIICSSKAQIPKIIDFEESTENGVPFFDLAYLEFDIMRHLLPVEREENRQYWLSLLNVSMAKIEGGEQQDIPWNASRTWKFIQPIRQGVQRLQPVSGEDYETIWWLSTVAVGLNFARKGDQARSQFEHMAGLLYAAYGLARLLEIFHVKEPTTEQPVFVPWRKGYSSSTPDLSTPLARQDLINPASLIEETLSASIEQTLDRPSPLPLEISYVQDLPLTSGTTAELFQDAAVFSDGEHPIKPPAQTEGENGNASKEKAEYFHKILQDAVGKFNGGRQIYRNECDTIDSNLDQLENFLQVIFQQTTLPISYPIKLSLQNISQLQKDIQSDLHSFREICPPTTKNLPVLHYQKELASIRRKLEELLQDFLELLKKIS